MNASSHGKIMFDSNTSNNSANQDMAPNDTPTDTKINPGEESKKFNDLLKSSQHPIIKLKAVFPFQLVPDELIVDINRVSFIKKTLFSKEATALEIKDITEVIITNDPFFAALMIESKVLVEEKIYITHLPKADARKAQAILHGMIACLKQGINYQEVPIEELPRKLELIGRPNSDEEQLAQPA